MLANLKKELAEAMRKHHGIGVKITQKIGDFKANQLAYEALFDKIESIKKAIKNA